MKNKRTVFGSKGILFLCAIALAVVGLTLTGCDDGSGDDTSGPKWPAAWEEKWISSDTNHPDFRLEFFNGNIPWLNIYNNSGSDSFYKLKSFTGGGSSTGNFTIKKLAATDINRETGDVEDVEVEDLITVTYSMSSGTLTLTSADVSDWVSGVPYIKNVH